MNDDCYELSHDDATSSDGAEVGRWRCWSLDPGHLALDGLMLEHGLVKHILRHLDEAARHDHGVHGGAVLGLGSIYGVADLLPDLFLDLGEGEILLEVGCTCAITGRKVNIGFVNAVSLVCMLHILEKGVLQGFNGGLHGFLILELHQLEHGLELTREVDERLGFADVDWYSQLSAW